jgi:hypothetical protein
MRSLFIGRMAAMLLAAGALLVLGIGAASAQAAPRSSVGPDFTCPTGNVCIYKKTQYTGREHSFNAKKFDQWTSLENYAEFPWGSLRDRTGSSVYFYNKSIKKEFCFPPGSRSPDPGPRARNSRYMKVRYGSDSCSHITPP